MLIHRDWRYTLHIVMKLLGVAKVKIKSGLVNTLQCFNIGARSSERLLVTLRPYLLVHMKVNMEYKMLRLFVIW